MTPFQFNACVSVTVKPKYDAINSYTKSVFALTFLIQLPENTSLFVRKGEYIAY